MLNAYSQLKNLDSRTIELLDIILKQGMTTKNILSDMTNMKKSTLNRAMEILIEKELVVEAASGESTGGRKPVLFDVNSEKYYLVGVDISRTYIQIVVANLKMNVAGEEVFYGGYSVEEAINLVCDCIIKLLDKLSIDSSMVVGIGVGVVRYNYKPEEDKFEKGNNALIKKVLEKKLGLPVFIDNGANTAVMAEYYFGYGRGKGSISYINCGVGIRTGVISDGILIRTVNNCEDAFGHMIVQMDGELCTCGNYGCVESYASIPKIKSRFVSKVKKGRTTKLDMEVETVELIDICNLAENNDVVAADIIMDAAAYFGTGLANYIKLLSPRMIILSGPLIQYSSLFYETSKNMALKKCRSHNVENIEFSRGGYFKDKSMAIGAAYLVLDEILKSNKRKV